MAEFQRVQLPFGQGLDRETGILATRPGTFEDIQNVFIHQGKAIVRTGFEAQVTLYDDEENEVSHILQGHSLRSERIGVVVSYQETTDKVWVHRTDTLSATAELIGEWENDLGWDETVPRVLMAEVYGRVFMAHDTRYVTERAPTLYYDPVFGAEPLNVLEGDMDGGGDVPMRFRGVKRHLKYLFGWGYGSDSEDRPELVRSSEAGAPQSFKAEHYFIAGDRRDPVLACHPAGGNLVVFKEVEAHVILGTGRDDFGIFPLDPLYGCLGSHLAANRSGDVLAWSAEGPRVWNGRGPSQEIAVPLELGGAEPTDLVEEGDAEIAFASYIPEARIMAFVFGQRLYCLTMRVEGDWKWSYWSLKTNPLCGYSLYPGPQDTRAPTGHPQISGIVSGGTYSDYEIVNWNQDGDETLEIWLSEDSDPWFLAKSVLVSPTSGTNQTPTPRVEGLTPGTSYRMACRYRRGVLYTEGYTDADPWNWPSVSRATYNTAIAPPTWVSGVWSRTATAVEQILLTVTPAVGQEAQDIEVYRNTILVQTISGPHVGNAEWADTGVTGETTESYEFLTKGGTGDSIKSDPETVWAGPALPPSMDWVISAGDEGYEAGVILGNPADDTQMWDNYDDAGGTTTPALRYTMTAGVTTGDSGALTGLPLSPAITIEIKCRHIETAYTTDDFSEFSAVMELDIQQDP